MRKTSGLAVALTAGISWAGEVYVNGSHVEGLTNQTFEKVTVRLDERGNVHIDAPGYSVKKVWLSDSTPAPAAASSITQKYFLVTEQKPWGGTDTEVDLVLNGVLFKTIRSSDAQLVLDITDSLVPGLNRVQIKARRRAPDGGLGRSHSRAHVFRIFVGEGTVEHDEVTMGKQLVFFTRNGAEVNDSIEEFTFTTR